MFRPPIASRLAVAAAQKANYMHAIKTTFGRQHDDFDLTDDGRGAA